MLRAGTRLGPYEIVALLGAGGMGEVYRARDERIGREVAVKVLPTEFASDPERLRRFEQEARAAGALNHPNVLALYDVGTVEGSPYLVTELLEGESLRERLSGGAMPVRKAVELGVQMAHGLAAAHAKGIVHRDLKPGNVFLTRDGVVKILDFGIAKLAAPRGAEELGRATTVAEATEAGARLGTVGYMSPEQVRGQSVDYRTDIFSFGCVLYEMLSGKRAFVGDTAADTMSAILHEDPAPLGGTGREVPPVLQGIVSRCLEKSPDDRFQSARDLAFDLALLARISDTGTGPMVAPPPRKWRTVRPWVMVAVALAGGAGLFLLGARTSRAPQPSFKRITLRRGSIGSAVFTPDFQSVVYSASWDGKQDELFVQRLGSSVARSLGVINDSISVAGTTGDYVMIVRDGTLARLPLEGGNQRELLTGIEGASVQRGGTRFAVVRYVGELDRQRLEYPPGKVLLEATGAESICTPSVSPDGERIAFHLHGQSRGGGDLCVIDTSGTRRTLSKGWTLLQGGVAWSPDGREVWFQASRVRPLELRAVTLSGKERLVARLPGHSIDVSDIAPDGRVLAAFMPTLRRELRGRMAGDTAERDLSWLDGTCVPLLAPDGTQMLFRENAEGGGPNSSAYHWRMGDPTPTRLGDGMPVLVSPDWTTAVVQVKGGGKNELQLVPLGAGETRTLPRGAIHAYYNVGAGTWHPDGKRIFIRGKDAEGTTRVFVQDVAGGLPRPFADMWLGPLSTDGRFFIAYPNKEGEPGYLLPIDGGGARPMPFLKADDNPIVFGDDGRSLFILDRSTFPVHIARLNLTTGKREPWLELAPPDRAGVKELGTFDLTPNGRFYVYGYQRMLSDLYLIEGLK